VAQELGCSTQPVMYHFTRMEELRQAAYDRVDEYHTAYLLKEKGDLLGIGLNYLRFALEEPHLFRFLFQSGYALAGSLPQLAQSPAIEPILTAIQEGSGLSEAQAREVFLTLALWVHGYAGLLVNGGIPYDEASLPARLEKVYHGAVLAAKEESV